MPIRTVSLPAPSDVVAAARRELAPRYGARVWEGPDRRVLLVRVPREQPDPVNDVEEAVEFLQPADTRDVTHCLLVGEGAVAQVYTRPLQELMRERERFDRATAAAWRERMPGRLGHVVFQAPDDPRRRWRLAVRLPLGSVRELDEEMLSEVADGIGAELETERFSRLAAVYLIAGQDDVRLEADLFVQELRGKWREEEDRRRQRLERAQREADEQRKREEERRRLLREMERRVAKARWAKGAQDASARGQQRDVVGLDGAQPAEGNGRGRREEVQGAANQSPPGRAPLAEDVAVIRAREPASAAEAAARRRTPMRIPHTVRELRARVDQVVGAPRGARSEPAGDMAAQPDDAMDRRRGPGSPAALPDTEAAATEAPVAGRRGPMQEESVEVADVPQPRRQEERGRPAARETPPARARAAVHQAAPTALRPLVERLEASGFEILLSPSTAGHIIDVAAERPQGKPQRLVARGVDRVDEEIAGQLLKTARELDVDLVLCVADHVAPEAGRMLVATKVEVVAPDAVAGIRL